MKIPKCDLYTYRNGRLVIEKTAKETAKKIIGPDWEKHIWFERY